MSNFSIWHFFVAVAFACILLIVGLAVWLVRRARVRSLAGGRSRTPSSRSVDARLKQLADLKSKELITDTEYEMRRSAILEDT